VADPTDGWKRECADADELLRIMFPGHDADEFRTDGGNINLAKEVRDRIARRARYRWAKGAMLVHEAGEYVRASGSGVAAPEPLTDKRLDELWAEFSAAGYRGTLWEFINVARFVEQAVLSTRGVEPCPLCGEQMKRGVCTAGCPDPTPDDAAGVPVAGKTSDERPQER
jgi:hypothetical protein